MTYLNIFVTMGQENTDKKVIGIQNFIVLIGHSIEGGSSIFKVLFVHQGHFFSQNFSTRMTYLNKKFSISLNFKAT